MPSAKSRAGGASGSRCVAACARAHFWPLAVEAAATEGTQDRVLHCAADDSVSVSSNEQRRGWGLAVSLQVERRLAAAAKRATEGRGS